MIKFLKKLSITFIILVIGILYLSEIATTYKFGILVSDYNQTKKYNELLNKKPTYFAVNDNINKYSWNTPIKLPNSNIHLKIEHLVIVNDVDIALIPEINDKKNFLTIIEYLKGKVISIKIENTVDGFKLKEKSKYAYTKSKDQNQNFDIVKIDKNTDLSLYPNHLAIGVIFPFHEKLQSPFIGIQKYQFDKAYQKITIEYLNSQNKIQKEEYVFNLEWYYYMTGWDKFITIT